MLEEIFFNVSNDDDTHSLSRLHKILITNVCNERPKHDKFLSVSLSYLSINKTNLYSAKVIMDARASLKIQR